MNFSNARPSNSNSKKHILFSINPIDNKNISFSYLRLQKIIKHSVNTTFYAGNILNTF